MLGLVISALDNQSRGSVFKSRPGQKFGSRFLHASSAPLANSTMMTRPTLTVGRQDGEGQNWPQPSHAEAKKIKSLTLHPHGCSKAAKGYSSIIGNCLGN